MRAATKKLFITDARQSFRCTHQLPSFAHADTRGGKVPTTRAQASSISRIYASTSRPRPTSSVFRCRSWTACGMKWWGSPSGHRCQRILLSLDASHPVQQDRPRDAHRQSGDRVGLPYPADGRSPVRPDTDSSCHRQGNRAGLPLIATVMEGKALQSLDLRCFLGNESRHQRFPWKTGPGIHLWQSSDELFAPIRHLMLWMLIPGVGCPLPAPRP